MSESRTLPVFTNHTDSNEHINTIGAVLGTFYRGAAENRVGIMSAFNIETEDEELILVGLATNEDGTPDIFPIAKILTAEDIPNYLAPDGKGGWISKEPEHGPYN